MLSSNRKQYKQQQTNDMSKVLMHTSERTPTQNRATRLEKVAVVPPAAAAAATMVLRGQQGGDSKVILIFFNEAITRLTLHRRSKRLWGGVSGGGGCSARQCGSGGRWPRQ